MLIGVANENNSYPSDKALTNTPLSAGVARSETTPYAMEKVPLPPIN